MKEHLQNATGFFPDVPAEVYHSLDRVSSSYLSELRKSPLHCWTARKSPKEATPAMALGTLLHSAILEPASFYERYFCLPDVDGRTTKGKEALEAARLENAGKEGVKTSDWQQIEAITRVVLSHPAAGAIVESVDEVELSALFDDRETGLKCKARLDGLSKEFDAIIDLKSCAVAERSVFEKSIFNFGYHRQGAFYRHACSMLGLAVRNHILIAVEKTAPYAVAVYRLTDDALNQGAKECRELLQQWSECERFDRWKQGYSENIQDISLPAWALKQTFEAEEN